jgi:hypothetical protein
MEPKKISFCQRLGLLWPIHDRLLYRYIARSNAVRNRTTARALQPGTGHLHLDGFFFLIHIIVPNGTKEFGFLPKVGLVLANMS